MKVKLTAPVVHDKNTLERGTELELTDQQALRLERLGVCIIIPDSAAPSGEEASHKSDSQDAASGEGNTPDDEQPGENEGLLDGIITLSKPDAMPREELEAELTAAGVEFRDGASMKALIALVKKHRQENQ